MSALPPSASRLSLLTGLFHPSGGLIYHWRAWRWRRTLWAPFHDQVRRWLTDWRPACTHLVLVGPSGGYALSRQFLERFERITVLEPDPLARRILAWRFPGRPFNWRASGGLARPDGFHWLAARFPDGAFLFCNLLGQDLLGAPHDFDRSAWLARLEPGLSGHAWASWHDLASTVRPPDRQAVLSLAAAQPLDATLAHFWHGGELSIYDHLTAGLCPASPRQVAVWQLAPNRHHLIEWLACRG